MRCHICEWDGCVCQKSWTDSLAKKVMVWCKESDGLMRRIAAWLRRDSRHVTHTWLIAMCDMTHGDVWHDSLIQVSHTHGPTVFPQIVQQLSYTKYIYLIHTCDSFRTCWHVNRTCWHVHVCETLVWMLTCEPNMLNVLTCQHVDPTCHAL